MSTLVKNQFTLEQVEQLVDTLNHFERFPALQHMAEKYGNSRTKAYWVNALKVNMLDYGPSNPWEKGDIIGVADGCGFYIQLAPYFADLSNGFKWVYGFMIDAERRLDIRAATYEIAQVLYPSAPKAIYVPDWVTDSLSHYLIPSVTFEQWEEYIRQHLKVLPSPLDIVYPNYEAMKEAVYELAPKFNVERYEFYYIDTFDDFRNLPTKQQGF